jgi:hypothetical protein
MLSVAWVVYSGVIELVSIEMKRMWKGTAFKRRQKYQPLDSDVLIKSW